MSYGPSSWQPSGPGAGESLKMFGGIVEPSMGEDCLVLKVWPRHRLVAIVTGNASRRR